MEWRHLAKVDSERVPLSLSWEGTGSWQSLKSAKFQPGALPLPQLKMLQMRPHKGFAGVKSQIPAAQGSFYIPVPGV